MQTAVVFEPHKEVTLEKFLPELRFEFTDLPDPLFKWAIIRAARDMARDGNIIRRNAVVDAAPGVSRYPLRSPDGLEVCGILGIKKASCLGHAPVGRTFDPPDDAMPCGRELAWYDDVDGVLHLPLACPPERYFLFLSVMPADDACTLPEAYYREHIDVLMTGAKARIMRISGKPWTNLQMADAYERHFHEGVAAAAVDAHTHLMRGAVRMNFGRTL